MNRRRLLTLACAAGALAPLAACSANVRQVVAYTSVDQVFSEPVFQAFERQSGIRVRAVYDTEETKSTGVLNRLIAEAQNPQADVFWSGDPVRPFQLIRRNLVEPYVSPESAGIPDSFKAADGTWTGFAARARVLLANRSAIGHDDPNPPRGIADLGASRWRGQTTIANPLYGTTTMHVGALFSLWGEERTRAFLEQLKANGVRIAASNGEVKRLVAAGEAALGLTDTDDANEARREGADVTLIYPDQDELGALVIPTAAVLMRGAPHPETARALIDYLLSADVERQMAESAAHMPLREGVPTPAHVPSVSQLRAMAVDYGRVAEQIEAQQEWLRQWAGL